MTWLVLGVMFGMAVLAIALNARIAGRRPRRGEPAPPFHLPDQQGADRELEEFRGQWLVLYFYPRDDTPGCTEQALRFRAAMHELEKLGARVCGISVDDGESHARFARKYDLPFALLADRHGAVARRYGSLVELGLIRFARRNTFLIDPHGKVAAVYVGVSAARNAAEVGETLRTLRAG